MGYMVLVAHIYDKHSSNVVEYYIQESHHYI